MGGGEVGVGGDGGGGGGLCLTPCIQGFFLYFFKEIRVCEHTNG